MADGDVLPASMNEHVAVVTGGTQGLGEATARLFARRGAAGLVICGRNADRGRSIAAELTAAGCETRFVAADLAEVESCRLVVSEADRAFGRIDTLVNCAGITQRGTIWDTGPALFDRIFSVNVRAPFFLIQETAKVMRREAIPGTMVNVISMASHGGQPFISAYCASKGALATLTRNVANALLPYRIRVNGLNIGWTDTPAEHDIQKRYHGADDGWLAAAERRQPFGRLIKVDEVARAIAFLASHESGLMTGSLVDFDQTVLGASESPPPPSREGSSP